jgi:hypothetical protein
MVLFSFTMNGSFDKKRHLEKGRVKGEALLLLKRYV